MTETDLILKMFEEKFKNLERRLDEKEATKQDKHHTVSSWSPRFCPDGDCTDEQAGPKYEPEAKCQKCGLFVDKIVKDEKGIEKPAVERCPNCGNKHFVKINSKQDYE